MEYQIHFGRKFYKDQKSGYWISSNYTITEPRIRAHRWVWECIHGKIPKGYHIHHKDENKSNNNIENLELIEQARHLSIHASKPEHKKRSKELCDKIRPLTKKWHASEEGKKWHRLHAIRSNFGKGPLHNYNCLLCGKEYQSRLTAKGRTKFCSNNCKTKWRKKSGIDNIEFACEKCKKICVKNKYSQKKFCSQKCSKSKF